MIQHNYLIMSDPNTCQGVTKTYCRLTNKRKQCKNKSRYKSTYCHLHFKQDPDYKEPVKNATDKTKGVVPPVVKQLLEADLDQAYNNRMNRINMVVNDIDVGAVNNCKSGGVNDCKAVDDDTKAGGDDTETDDTKAADDDDTKVADDDDTKAADDTKVADDIKVVDDTKADDAVGNIKAAVDDAIKTPRWSLCWCGDRGGYTPFETPLAPDKRVTVIEIVGNTYTIDMGTMTQQNMATNYVRSIAIYIYDGDGNITSAFMPEETISMTWAVFNAKGRSLPIVTQRSLKKADSACVTSYFNKLYESSLMNHNIVDIIEDKPADEVLRMMKILEHSGNTVHYFKAHRPNGHTEQRKLCIANKIGIRMENLKEIIAVHQTGEEGITGVLADDQGATRPLDVRCGLKNKKTGQMQGNLFGIGLYLTRLSYANKIDELDERALNGVIAQYAGEPIVNEYVCALIFKVYHSEKGIENIAENPNRMKLTKGKHVGLCPNGRSIVISELYLDIAVLEGIVAYRKNEWQTIQ